MNPYLWLTEKRDYLVPILKIIKYVGSVLVPTTILQIPSFLNKPYD